jgi:hypothetical protein
MKRKPFEFRARRIFMAQKHADRPSVLNDRAAITWLSSQPEGIKLGPSIVLSEWKILVPYLLSAMSDEQAEALVVAMYQDLGLTKPPFGTHG